MAKKAFVQNKGNTAICYYRYSSDAQRDCSIEQQQQEAQKYAKAHGYRIVKEYCDRAVSGTRNDRVEYQLMLSEIKRLRPSVLILWKTDRLSRDKYESNIAKAIIKNAGCKVEYIAEQIPEDEGVGLIVEALYEAMAENYIVQLRHNVTRGLRYNAEKCLYNGVKIIGYTGKTNEKYKIDENTSVIVQKIFNDYANGVSMKQIVEGLNEAGIKTSKGNDFTINSIRAILQNRAYLGEYHYADIVVADGMPRLVSDELFETVQEKLKKNKHGGNRKVKEKNPKLIDDRVDFWLTDHVVCGKCGSSLHGISGTSKQGKLHYYYACNNHRLHKCDMKNVRKDDLEKIISFELENVIRDSSIRMMIAHKCYEYYKSQHADSEGYEQSLEVQIKEIDKKLNNIMKAIEDGIYNATTSQRMKELEEQKQLMSDELSTVRIRKKYEMTEADILRFLDSMIDESSSRQMLLDSLVEKVYVYDDKLVISYYYTDDKREIAFEDMKQHIKNIETINGTLDKHDVDVSESSYDETFWSLVEPKENPDSF